MCDVYSNVRGYEPIFKFGKRTSVTKYEPEINPINLNLQSHISNISIHFKNDSNSK